MELCLVILTVIAISIAIGSIIFVRILSDYVDELDHEINHLMESNVSILEHVREVLEFNSKLIKETEDNENS